MPLTGLAAVECRNGGADGNYTLVIQRLNNPIASGAASVTSGSGSVAGAPAIVGKTMTIQLTGVTNAQTVAVTLQGVTDVGNQVLPNTTVSFGVLVGDTNGDRTVNSGDALQTRSRSGQVTDATNLRSDVSTWMATSTAATRLPSVDDRGRRYPSGGRTRMTREGALAGA